jgi:hypothetical protein
MVASEKGGFRNWECVENQADFRQLTKRSLGIKENYLIKTANMYCP